MKFCSISDVHVKNYKDETYKDLLKFMNCKDVGESSLVLFLGDIFDFMVGPHKQYAQDYSDFFKKIRELLQSGKQVYYFEGNHDVHLNKLFRKNEIEHKNFTLLKKPEIHQINGKRFYFSHGDEVDYQDIAYLNYKETINNKFCEFLANNIVPYKLLQPLGERASAASRARGYLKFNHDEVKNKYRDLVQNGQLPDSDVYIFGHNHVMDQFQFTKNNTLRDYFNNGYFPRDKSYIFYDGQKAVIKNI